MNVLNLEKKGHNFFFIYFFYIEISKCLAASMGAWTMQILREETPARKQLDTPAKTEVNLSHIKRTVLGSWPFFFFFSK